jgi:hypothetical protein
MRMNPFITLLACLAGAQLPCLASDSIAKCYDIPVRMGVQGGIGENLQASIDRHREYEKNRGTDMQKWDDTAQFGFDVAYRSADTNAPVPRSDPKKDTIAPPSQGTDTISPAAYRKWTQALVDKYEVFDYFHPDTHMAAPEEPFEVFGPMIATQAVLLALGQECYVGVLEAWSPPHLVDGIIAGAARKSATKSGKAFNALGRNGKKNTEAKIPQRMFYLPD